MNKYVFLILVIDIVITEETIEIVKTIGIDHQISIMGKSFLQ